MVREARLQAYRYGAAIEQQSRDSLRTAAITLAAWWEFVAQFLPDDQVLHDYLVAEFHKARQDIRTGQVDTFKLRRA